MNPRRFAIVPAGSTSPENGYTVSFIGNSHTEESIQLKVNELVKVKSKENSDKVFTAIELF